MSTYGTPTTPPPYQPLPAQPPKRKGLHPLAITGIVLGSLLLLCCIGAGAFTLLSGEDDPAAQPDPAPSGPVDGAAPTGEPVDEQPDTPGIGDPARDGQFEFVVTDVETGIESVGDNFLGKEAQGQFVFVHVTVENIGDQAQYFDGSSQALIDTEGREHSADGEAGIYVEDSESFLNEINPGNMVEGIVVFDIPADATPQLVRMHDSPFSGGVEVDLS